MMNAAAGIFLAARSKKGWTNPYVTDGLVAQWDGEWNAGGGVHDSAATTWKDLSGNGYDYTIASGSWGSDHYVVGGLRCAYCGNMPTDVHTIEIVMKSNYDSNVETIIWATEPVDSSSYGKRQCCWALNGGIGFGYKGYSCPQNKGTVSCFGCTFGTGGDPLATFFNGATYAYSGSKDYFNNTAAKQMGINVRYGTFVGEIYSLRLNSRALTADEIAANFAVDKARFNLP